MTVILNTGYTTNSSTRTIQDLSPELLSYIFFMATHHLQDRAGSILQPITISHVSSRWREIAISTRALWTSIILSFPIFPSQLLRSQIWLSRSHPLPIDIFLDFRDPSWDWEEDSLGVPLELMAPVLKFLLADVKRWRHFELLTDTWAPIFAFLQDTRDVDAAPLLRSISLSRCNAYFASKGAVFQPVQFQDPIPLFGGLALDALRDVSLVGVHVDWAQSSLRNLTSLRFKYHASGVMPSLDQFIDILSGCPELRHLSIVGWGPQFEKATVQEIWDPTSSPNLKIIQLRHLVDFFFGFVDVDHAIKALSLFNFPSIQILTLEDVSSTLNPAHQNDATPILDYLTPSDASESTGTTMPQIVCGIPLNSICTLQLERIHASDGAFSRFFSALTSLHKLGLFSIEDLTLRSLLPQHPSCHHYPCPNLRELLCRNVNRNTLMDVVRSRIMTDSDIPLKCVLFDTDSDNPLMQDDFDDHLKF